MSFKNWISEKTGILVIPDSLPHPVYYDESSNSIDIPGYLQVDSFSCGFVAGLMVLHHFQPRRSLTKFYQVVSPDEDYGTSWKQLKSALEKFNVKVVKKASLNFDEVIKHIDGGKPIIACIKHFGYQHWLVIYGYSELDKTLYIAGNSTPFIGRALGEHVMNWSYFKKVLRNYDSVLICSKLHVAAPKLSGRKSCEKA